MDSSFRLTGDARSTLPPRGAIRIGGPAAGAYPLLAWAVRDLGRFEGPEVGRDLRPTLLFCGFAGGTPPSSGGGDSVEVDAGNAGDTGTGDGETMEGDVFEGGNGGEEDSSRAISN